MNRLALVILVACGNSSTDTGTGTGDTTLDRELATMRAHDQHVWNLSAMPAMHAASDVFAKLDFVGKTSPELTAMIGVPMKVEAGIWQYYFHNGEAGVVRYFHFDRGRVSRMHVMLTR